VIVHCGPGACTGHAAEEETAVDNPTKAPLTCRWHLHHHWSWVSTEDGDRYERCTRCGKDRLEKFGDVITDIHLNPGAGG
jgi:hypothetical protein